MGLYELTTELLKRRPRFSKWPARHKVLFFAVVIGLIGRAISPIFHLGHEWTAERSLKMEDARVGGDLVQGDNNTFNNFYSKAPIASCEIAVTIGTDIVARLYHRTTIDEVLRQKFLPPQFQELFYEWELRLSGKGPVGKVSGKFRSIPEDRCAVDPSTGHVSDAVGAWFSGFPEPARQKPDYYVRTFDFNYLGMARSATVRSRRPLTAMKMSKEGLIQLMGVRAEGCTIGEDGYNLEKDADRLSAQAQKLAQWKFDPVHFPDGLPMKPDPGDVGKGEIQLTEEARCKSDTCEELTLRRMQGNARQSSDKYFSSRATCSASNPNCSYAE